jgi:choline dehydrogenase-like flavoprotein
MSNPYDVIVIGSGAGGAAAVNHLVRAGLSVALIEKGLALPRDSRTLNVQQVVHEGRFKSSELWQDGRGRRFAPEEYFNLGGKTKWYGAALLRYAAGEMVADTGYQCPGWPIEQADLSGFYDNAERMLGVREFDCEPALARISDTLLRRSPGWRSEPLPLGLSERILSNPEEAAHFDGFASPLGLKSDAESAFLEPIRHLPNLELHTGVMATELIGRSGDSCAVEGVRLSDGRALRARSVILAAGALHSPRLLQSYLENTGLALRLPCYDVVGRHLKMHLLTAMVAVSPRRIEDAIRKTRIFTHADLPHSSVQPLGFDGELIGTLIPKLVPRWLARQIGARSYGFFLQTEDGAHPDNRVRAASGNSGGLPVLDYDASRTPAALAEHERLVRRFRVALLRTGLVAFSQRIGVAGTAHVSGTLTAGADPRTSVVDANGLVHGLRSLYVVDGSVLPRSSRVNPSLTIYAWSMRVAQRLSAELNQPVVRRA